MKPLPIGIDVGDLRTSPKDAIRSAAALSFQHVEVPTVAGDISAQTLSPSGRRHFARYVTDLGLNLCALAADMPALRLTDSRTVEERVERTTRIIEMAKEIGTPIVTTSVGALTDSQSTDTSPIALEALARIGEVADATGVSLAIRPSADGGEKIARILQTIACPALKVGWDPAAMVMRGVNPLAAIEQYVEHIALFHARDASAGEHELSGIETGLGEGEVDLVGVLDVLRSLDYNGPYILRRTDSQRPVDELLAGRDLLTRELTRR